MHQKAQQNNSKSKFNLPQLDGLRFIAFFLVFIMHSTIFSKIPYLSYFNINGRLGVDIFFCLSAYLITKLLLDEYSKTNSINILNFYIRRILRIWPLYFFFLFSILIFFFTVSNEAITNYSVARQIGLITFTDNILTAIYGFNSLPYSAHLWTLAYEMQFYIFIPIIILIVIRTNLTSRLIFIFLLFILFTTIRIIFIAKGLPHPAIWVLPITNFEPILLGTIMGFGGLNFLSKKLGPLIIGFVGLIFVILLGTLPPPNVISYWLLVYYLFAGVGTSFIVFSILNSKFLTKIFSSNTLIFLGKRSYGLYVYHLLSLGLAFYIVSALPFFSESIFLVFLFALVFTILISIMSYKFLEIPFLKIKRKYEVIQSKPID